MTGAQPWQYFSSALVIVIWLGSCHSNINQCIAVCQFEFITEILMKNIIQTKHILCLLDFVDKCNGSKAILACNAIDIVLENKQGKQMSYSIAHLHLHAFSP